MDLMDYRRKIIANSPHLKSASGAIATFSDGMDLPLKSLTVGIEPVQDLHGQANPYPAGGSTNMLKSTPYGSSYNGAVGRDLKSVTSNVMDYAVTSDGKVAIDVTTAWNGRLFATDALAAGAYTFRFWADASSNIRATWYVTDSDLVVTELVSNQSSTGWHNVLTRTVTEGQRIALSIASTTAASVKTEFQVNTGSSIAPIVPFENICPISGWNGVKVTRTGENLIDSRLSVVQAVNTNGTWNNNVYTLNGLTFTVADDGHITINGTSTANTYFTVYRNSEGITLPAGSYVLHKSGSADIIVAAPKNGAYWTSATTNDSVVSLAESARVSYYVQIRNGKTFSNYNLYPMFEAGSTATPYEPYNGVTVTVQLGETVYGGTLNPLTGVMTAYPYYASYNGETLTGRWVSDRDKYVAGTTPTIGAQVVDMSGTGTEIQLTPQQIRSLYGSNTIFADTGTVALEYWAHP